MLVSKPVAVVGALALLGAGFYFWPKAGGAPGGGPVFGAVPLVEVAPVVLGRIVEMREDRRAAEAQPRGPPALHHHLGLDGQGGYPWAGAGKTVADRPR